MREIIIKRGKLKDVPQNTWIQINQQDTCDSEQEVYYFPNLSLRILPPIIKKDL